MVCSNISRTHVCQTDYCKSGVTSKILHLKFAKFQCPFTMALPTLIFSLLVVCVTRLASIRTKCPAWLTMCEQTLLLLYPGNYTLAMKITNKIPINTRNFICIHPALKFSKSPKSRHTKTENLCKLNTRPMKPAIPSDLIWKFLVRKA